MFFLYIANFGTFRFMTYESVGTFFPTVVSMYELERVNTTSPGGVPLLNN